MIYALGSMVCSISAISTSIIVIKLHRHWSLHASCVLWLFFKFFAYLTLVSIARTALFVTLLVHRKHLQANQEMISLTPAQLERLGLHSIAISNMAHNKWLSTIAILKDTVLLGVAIWLMLLTYELSEIAIKSMDRGSILEQKRIRVYNWSVHILLLICGGGQGIEAIMHHGYTIHVHRWLLVNYMVHAMSLVYMFVALTRIKVKGRKYEAMHGTFVPSPVYKRLKRIMIVYAAFSVQFQISSVTLGWTNNIVSFVLEFISISMVIYNCTGFALVIAVGCSQSCVLKTCRLCIPDGLEAQLLERRLQKLGLEPEMEVLPPREDSAVFVYTDIESSSALWAHADETVMTQSTELHDSILRSSLTRYHGYEITTCGDSFHLVFHSIKDAVSYCMDVQLQLLAAPWPKALSHVLPATKKQRYGNRLIFNGLRVRMGVHDCVQSIDGPLVCALHVVTGKMIYTGASEVMASEVCELGHGGQILVTKRIVEWLQAHPTDVEVEYGIKYMGHCEVARLCWLDLYEVTPSVLAGREQSWNCSHLV